MIRFVAPLIFALLLLVGCATAPEEEVPDAEDTALAAPEARRRIEDAAEPVPEAEARVVSPRDRYIMLELAQAPAAAAVEVRITGENGTDPLRLDRYSVEAGGIVRVPTAGLRSGESYLLQLRYVSEAPLSPWSEPIRFTVAALELPVTLYFVDGVGRYPVSEEDTGAGGENDLARGVEEDAGAGGSAPPAADAAGTEDAAGAGGSAPPAVETEYFPLDVAPPATVDRSPEFLVASAAESPISRIVAVLRDPRGERLEAWELTGAGGRFTATGALEPGNYTVELAGFTEAGVELPPTERAVIIRLPLPPRATAHGSGISPVPRPALRWSHQVGVSEYEVAFRSLPTAAATEQGRQEAPREETPILGETEVVRAGLLRLSEYFLTPGSSYEWRVRPRLETGPGPWSEPFRFRYEPVPLNFAEIIPPGETVTFTQGGEDGSTDEAPPREVTLTEPFFAAVTETTNLLTAALFNSGLRHGRFSVAGEVISRGDRPLLFLGSLEYGEQIGLTLVGDGDGRRAVESVIGRAAHPAVGISWYGAEALARELSFIEGRSVAPYLNPGEGETSAESATAGAGTANVATAEDRDRWVYRLPTEAEWEYIASGGEPRSFPWGEAPPRGRSNYYRSGDEFEDFNPPYTRNGGPTTPVGYFGESSPFGVRDLIGNVWEWCLDWYDPDRYALGPATDPRGPGSPVEDRFGVENRALRGLAWNSRVEDLRLTNRGKYPPELGSWSIGVRFVLAPPLP